MPGRIQQLWSRLETVLQQQCPAALETCHPPATQQQISDLQAKLKLQLPSELCELLLIFNGQVQENGSGRAIPIIPAEHSEAGVYLATWGEFGSVADIELWTQSIREVQIESPDIAKSLGKPQEGDEEKWEETVRQLRLVSPELADSIQDAFSERVWTPVTDPDELASLVGVYTLEHRWIIFCDPGSGDSIGVQINATSGIPVGSVCGINHEEQRPHLLAPDFETWFLHLVERYESGRYRITENDGLLGAIDSYDPDPD
ncbi:MAG: SMI1/KNR4 family protein [Planctomycetota bacterium]